MKKKTFPGTLSCFKQPLTKSSLLRLKVFFQRNKPGGEASWNWRPFLNLRHEKPHFQTLYPLSNKHSQNTLYCAWRLSSRETSLAKAKVTIQRLYTPNINNKGSTHHHLSFLSYQLIYMRRYSCWQLTNDNIQKRKASLVTVTAPRNKISKASNEWHQCMFSNILMTAQVTLKTMADQQSAWGSSLKGVLVIRCMRLLVSLRTRHNRLNSHMHGKLKLAPSSTCPCGQEDQTTKHVLQRCPLHKAVREDVWPVSTPLTTKL